MGGCKIHRPIACDLILPGVQLSTLESKDDSENRATMGQMAYLSQTGGTKWAQGGFLWLQGHTHTHTHRCTHTHTQLQKMF